MAQKLIDGQTVTLRGQDFIIPPMTFGQLKRLAPQFATLQKGGELTTDSMDAIIAVIHAAMQPNYPETTRETVEDLLDPTNITAAINAIMGASGLTKSGEAQAGN